MVLLEEACATGLARTPELLDDEEDPGIVKVGSQQKPVQWSPSDPMSQVITWDSGRESLSCTYRSRGVLGAMQHGGAGSWSAAGEFQLQTKKRCRPCQGAKQRWRMGMAHGLLLLVCRVVLLQMWVRSS